MRKSPTHIQYDSIAEMCDDCAAKTTLNPYCNSASNDDRRHKSADWDCNLGWKGALKLARDGWQLERKAGASMLLSTPNGKIEFAETGDEVDVGAFCSGEPECFIQRVGEVGLTIERVVVNCAYNGGVDARTIYAQGEKLWQWLIECHSKGIDVELTASFSIEFGIRHFTYSVLVHRIGDPLESHTFMAALHPAFFRRMGFRVAENYCDNLPENYGFALKELTPLRDMAEKPFAGCRFADIQKFNPSTPIESLPVI